MFVIVFLLFILVPIFEIVLFIQMGGVIGLWPTIGLVLLTAVIGASLVRSQGIATLTSVQSRLQQGELPAQQILEGVLLAAAGMLLLTPGFLTDALGMCVLLPQPRAWLAKQIMAKMVVKTATSGFHTGGGFSSGHSSSSNGDVFDGEYQRKPTDTDHSHRLP